MRCHTDECIRLGGSLRSKPQSHAKKHCGSRKAHCVGAIELGNRGKKAPRPAMLRKSGEAKGPPSHLDRAGLRDNPFPNFIRNTRNTQVRRKKGECVSTSKGSKFGHRFSNAISSILNAENGHQVLGQRMNLCRLRQGREFGAVRQRLSIRA